MKKVILASVALAAVASSNMANATASGTVCSAGPAGAYATVSSATDLFVKVPFSPKCSSNVFLQYNDQNSYFAVGSASTKGKNTFNGSTAGGSVKAHAVCSGATGCSSSEVTTALQAAPSS